MNAAGKRVSILSPRKASIVNTLGLRKPSSGLIGGEGRRKTNNAVPLDSAFERIKPHRNFRLFLIAPIDRGGTEGGGGEITVGGDGNEEEIKGPPHQHWNIDDSENDEIVVGPHIIWGERHLSEAHPDDQSALIASVIDELAKSISAGPTRFSNGGINRRSAASSSINREIFKVDDGIDEDTELAWRYLACAHDSVERKAGAVAESTRGVDIRTGESRGGGGGSNTR